MTNSGVAGGLAIFLIRVGESLGIGHAGLYATVYLATFLISNVVTNNAAAALLFPVAIDAAEKSGVCKLCDLNNYSDNNLKPSFFRFSLIKSY